ncbi:predicted protein [Sclerotinia sclerotiorum 1980 UF-70]|uniref:Uncharacterized protein n=1 Tax=Sclerotinia sclerotiorum (strain ATCC 18683 / 1980 / Ss-1) TaxID=665079 RepID=A7ESD1_SCLS1|nr:predicted protein [Sclerotinia sclerotiorum 1980 UF-70]EDN92373.1 predicted protein [Sclerotinia sclerotiorum 1980 UF-70]
MATITSSSNYGGNVNHDYKRNALPVKDFGIKKRLYAHCTSINEKHLFRTP